MARSSAVWVVIAGNASLPMATFTVKHEMITWLKRYFKPEEVNVYRYPAGDRFGGQVVKLDVGELFQ